MGPVFITTHGIADFTTTVIILMVFLCAIIHGMDGVLALRLDRLMVGMDILIGAAVITIGDRHITDLHIMAEITDQDPLIQFIMAEEVLMIIPDLQLDLVQDLVQDQVQDQVQDPLLNLARNPPLDLVQDPLLNLAHNLQPDLVQDLLPNLAPNLQLDLVQDPVQCLRPDLALGQVIRQM